MGRRVALLRGVNVGGHNRIPMPELRELLTRAGFDDVRTYLQSGNVALTSPAAPDEVAARCRRLIGGHYGLDIPVLVRDRDELEAITRRNPLEAVAVDPRRHLVTFLDRPLDPEVATTLATTATAGERCAVIGREIFSWHPDTIARSRLWALLTGPGLGATATARNWTTVTALLAMAGPPEVDRATGTPPRSTSAPQA